MTTPKRWYQLWMLQVLVAMAVMAAFVTLNLPHTRKAGTLPDDEGPELTLFVTEAGWPMQFIGTVRSAPSKNWLEGKVRVSVVVEDIHFVPLLIDIVVGLLLLAFMSWIVVRLIANFTTYRP